MQNFLAIGEILRPRGVKGVLKIRPLTDDIARFKNLSTVFVSKKDEMKIEQVVIERDFVFLKLDKINSIEDVEKLRSQKIYIKRENEIDLDEHTNFIVDMIGLTGVFAGDNEELGKLVDINQYGAADVYTFETEKGRVNVPALKKLVLKVDVEKGTIILDHKAFLEVAVYEV